MKVKMNYSLLSGTELGDFTRQFLAAIDISKLPEGTLKTLMLKLAATYSQFSKGFEFDRNDPFTIFLDSKDGGRDNRFKSLKNYIKSFETSDDAIEAEAASKLLEVIVRYGWSLDRLNYAEESVALNGLTSELNEKYTAELTTLSALNHVTKLKTAQIEFETVQSQRIENGAVNVPTITAFRKPLIDLLKRVAQTLENDIEATDSETLKAENAKIELLMSETMALVKASATRRDNQKATKENPETTQPSV